MTGDYPTSVRLPLEVREKIKKIAKERDVSPSQIIVEACIQYLDASTPGLCPSCHTQNEPSARYCQNCSKPLTEEASEELELLTKLILNPRVIKGTFEAADIDHVEETTPMNVAINTIYQLQKQIDELQPIAEWAKKKMEEENERKK